MLLKKLRSSIGALAFPSHQMNNASAAADIPKPATIAGEYQPSLCPFVMDSRKHISTIADSPAPVQSKFVPAGWRFSTETPRRSTTAASASATTPTPALTAKMDRQPRRLTSVPPITGPPTAPAPMMDMYSPMALPRSLLREYVGDHRHPIRFDSGNADALENLRRNKHRERDRAPAQQSSRYKYGNPSMNTCVRPKMSDSRPTGMNITLVLSVNPSAIHCTAGRSAPKCCAIRGSAIVDARLIGNRQVQPQRNRSEHPPLIVRAARYPGHRAGGNSHSACTLISLARKNEFPQRMPAVVRVWSNLSRPAP